MKPKVSVLITSYNHSDTLKRAIDSVLSQRCDFEFEVIVVDDGSTDDSAEILEQYEEIINVSILQTDHQGLMKTYLLGFRCCSGEYIALCDCDDYWIDDYKLQKQVEYMDKNLNLGASFTRATIKNENSIIVTQLPPKELNFNTMLKGGYMFSPTMILRASSLINFWGVFASKNFFIWDYPIYLYLSKITQIGYLNDVTACWVKAVESFSNTQTRRKRIRYVFGLLRIKWYFITTYGCKLSTLGFVVYKFTRDIYSIIFKRWYK
jgi:glycosyltransferase involved in cell wall biosynthesis